MLFIISIALIIISIILVIIATPKTRKIFFPIAGTLICFGVFGSVTTGVMGIAPNMNQTFSETNTYKLVSYSKGTLKLPRDGGYAVQIEYLDDGKLVDALFHSPDPFQYAPELENEEIVIKTIKDESKLIVPWIPTKQKYTIMTPNENPPREMETTAK